MEAGLAKKAAWNEATGTSTEPQSGEGSPLDVAEWKANPRAGA
jgi:hypothetical protein